MDAILTSFSSRADKSIGFRGVTPELSPAEATALMELHGQNVRILIEPWDVPPDAMIKIKSEVEHKTPSQRLRAVLFVWWQQQNKPGEFEEFYRINMNRLIEHVKSKLDQV